MSCPPIRGDLSGAINCLVVFQNFFLYFESLFLIPLSVSFSEIGLLSLNRFRLKERGVEQGGKSPFSLLSEPVSPSPLPFEPIYPFSLLFEPISPSSLKFNFSFLPPPYFFPLFLPPPNFVWAISPSSLFCSSPLKRAHRRGKKTLNSSTVRRFLFKSLHFHRLQKQSLFSPYKSL